MASIDLSPASFTERVLSVDSTHPQASSIFIYDLELDWEERIGFSVSITLPARDGMSEAIFFLNRVYEKWNNSAKAHIEEWTRQVVEKLRCEAVVVEDGQITFERLYESVRISNIRLEFYFGGEKNFEVFFESSLSALEDYELFALIDDNAELLSSGFRRD